MHIQNTSKDFEQDKIANNLQANLNARVKKSQSINLQLDDISKGIGNQKHTTTRVMVLKCKLRT